MAERRMFAKTIIDSDIFLDMPQTTQNLYFHLNMRADDEGFVNSPKKIMRMVGSNQNDLEVLLSKRYLIAFKSGVIVIKHFKLHNTIRKDRMKETLYVEEKALLTEKENGAYTELQPIDNQMSTNCTPSVLECSIVKSSIVECNTAEPKPKRKRFVPPSLDEIKKHIQEKEYNVNPEKFFFHYESNGWMAGRTKMKDWKSSLGKWNTSEYNQSEQPKPKEKYVSKITAEELESFKKVAGIV